ncbi:MAG: hypothetical protein AABN95_18120 [Acidobacteriota bacterium]
MPILTRKKLGHLIGVVSLLVAVLFIVTLEKEVPGPDGWPSTIKLQRNRVTGVTWAVDTETHRTLFMYWPEYDMHVHPVKIEKIDSNHWHVVFEDPKAH